MAILERISKNSQENIDEVFTRLYRYLLRPDIYYVATRCLTMRGDRNLALVRQPGQKCLDFAAAQGCRVTHTVETDEGTNPVDISLFGS